MIIKTNGKSHLNFTVLDLECCFIKAFVIRKTSSNVKCYEPFIAATAVLCIAN